MTPNETSSTRLLDLLAARHDQIRRISEQAWNDQHDIYISNSEWYVLARIYQKKPTIAEVTRGVHISRQAVHKLIKNLDTKGLVLVTDHPTSRKDKCIELSELGITCYEQNEALKAGLERDIANALGDDAFQQLQTLLQADWKL
ncbi:MULTISPECIES: MarR family winged helix-turn-helix transcriptional regulator [Exiguobacterium]|uniref:MarR family winged helix-turn-helix transcriptional regulator n=1 Tax=Exiguobacterium TaxID=33986 RepID=UPI001BEC1819|nr:MULTISPECIES: MarR family transcriptional regulator [Exiguobacterium]MCT4784031.1 MarR family transcriptional regulator [Exiguobacterium himgiriensis]